MCITSTARRKALSLKLLPTHVKTLTPLKSAATSALLPASLLKNTTHLSRSSLRNASLAVSLSALPGADLRADTIVPVVQHDYHDHSADPTVDPSQIKHKAKGGVVTPFPVKLHEMLDKIEADGLASVVSWQPHGRCFVVHQPSEFVDHVMPKYFKQTKMASFQRQLNLYGFNRLTGGLDKGAYYHELFLRGKVSLAYDIKRMRVKGTGVRLPTNPDNEPNFYALPPVAKPPASNPKSPPPENKLPSSASSPKAPPKAGDIAPLDMTHRRAKLHLESLNHANKIKAATALSTAALPSIAEHKELANPNKSNDHDDSDITFFEGRPFLYLDPSLLASGKKPDTTAPTLPLSMAKTSSSESLSTAANSTTASLRRPRITRSPSAIVSDSDDDDDSLPSFSASDMDWEGPLSSPTLQAHMRRTSFRSFAP